MQFYYTKIDLYTNECMHDTYGFGRPCLTLLASYMIVTDDKYNIN
jgi:hypothetical protein